LDKFVGDTISTIHILPFFPFSSDDGFSVIDYLRVNPEIGDWKDITRLGRNYRLMFDAVINHVSSQSEWFQGFLTGDPKYRNYFTVVEKDTDLSKVFRPRATPVITPFNTSNGKKYVWTTFSKDQIDLNFANPNVFIEVIDILLFFASQGVDFIRLDAVTFVWKEIGTSCINSAHTHRIVQTIRTIFDIVAPKVAIITETNVPHKDNIAYFGDGKNEAQMVYNFALPSLTLNTFYKGDAGVLTEWAATLDLPSDEATFFNFLACHDGIGLLPIKNILNKKSVNALLNQTKQSGGYVSLKINEDGTQSPYELNINYLDALSNPYVPETKKVIATRFLATQSIMLALRGVPGIYFHSLIGSGNWNLGVDQTGRYRTINREKMKLVELERELSDPHSLRHQVYSGFSHILKTRRSHPAFHPLGGQEILRLGKSLFTTIRSSLDGKDNVLCITNVTDKSVDLTVDLRVTPFVGNKIMLDLLSDKQFPIEKRKINISVLPYQVLWLK
jgi:sucrose phosphorylase